MKSTYPPKGRTTTTTTTGGGSAAVVPGETTWDRETTMATAILPPSLPIIRHWTYDPNESTISGYVGGSRLFPDGSPVTTSRIVCLPRQSYSHSSNDGGIGGGGGRRSSPSLSEGTIVQTRSGTRYVLGEEGRVGGKSTTTTTMTTTTVGGRGGDGPIPPTAAMIAPTTTTLATWIATRANRTASFILSNRSLLPSSLRMRLESVEPGRLRRYGRLLALSLFAMLYAIVHGGIGNAVDDGGGYYDKKSSLGAEMTSSLSSSIIEPSPNRDNCQIVYVLGVEGSIHHGVTPILRNLASHQVQYVDGAVDDNSAGSDPSRYDVNYADRRLRSALFGFSRNARSMDNPKMVRHTMRQLCPDDGLHHVILEDLSFPSGEYDDARTYRIHRQRWWYQSTMEQIAMSETALNHPFNLDKFYEAYSPYADIRFVVLHRPYIETIASHADHDGNAEQHSNVLRGYMLLIRRFLDAHANDGLAPPGGGGTRRKTWTLLCVERLKSSYYGGDDVARDDARRRIAAHLADFLGWDRAAEECDDCFDGWVESDKDHVGVLGGDNVGVLLEHMRKLGGIWPPEVEDALPEQKCAL